MVADARAQRGQTIAETVQLTRRGDTWFVPSQSGNDRYVVKLDPDLPRCTCPDYESRQMRCKHIHAVEYTVARERNPDGTTTVTETLTVTEAVEKRATYPQNWPAYNMAQSVEGERVQVLLADLCRDLPEPDRKPTRGHRPHTVKDSVFAMVFKVYGTFSARRFSTDLRDAHDKGYVTRPIPGLKVPQFFENPAYTLILKGLVARSALPLRAVETQFAIDSSGFGSSRYDRWSDHKYGVEKRQVVWVKCHIACGVKTNVVSAVRILDANAHDSPQFAPLVKETAEGFVIGEVSADKAYSSYDNFETVAACGGEAFIAFKLGTTAAGGGTFQKMFHYFCYKRDEYLTRYHRRSNVESTFSMIKRKFGPDVRSKTDTAMVNEVLCKLVAHNLCVLNHEAHELGIDPTDFRPGVTDNDGLLRINP